MSDKSGGFFSSMGRFFSGGSASKSNEGEKSPSGSTAGSSEDGVPTTSSRSPSTAAPATLLKDIISIDNEAESSEVVVDTAHNTRPRLRHLSPSALDQRPTNPSSRLQIDVDSEQDIFFSTPSASTNRKRQLTELDRHALPHTFRSDSVKRSRVLNRSLLEPTVLGALTDRRLDRTWCGELTANHSPASSVTNFSMLSRRSGATTNGSLSTRTQEIFKRLEGTNTPAKEIQRMSMIRAGLSRPERWALNESRDNSSVGTPPPPLKKAGDAIPSRIQLISKSMGLSARKAPYWTDLTRKRTVSKNGDNGSSETSSMKSLNGTFASAELCSVFSLDPPVPKKASSSGSTASTTTMNSSNSRRPHVAILKGPDGKPVSRNTFKLTDDSDEDEVDTQKLPPLPEATLSNPQPLKLLPQSSLKRGFLNNLAFSFDAPLDVVSAVGTAKTASIASSARASSDSKEVDSDSNESTEKQESSSSESDEEESDAAEAEADAPADEVKESRPHTSADTISSAEGSNPSGLSSKDSSPKTAPLPAAAVVENWTCQECFLSWDQSKSACGACGTARPGATVAQKPAANWTCQECFLSWDQTKSACGACGAARAGSSVPAAQPPAAKQLVSNLKDFAPKTTTSSFSFGFGGGASSSSKPATTLSAAPAPVPTKEKPLPSLFGGSTTSTTAPAPQPAPVSIPAAPTSTTEGRVDWNCPDCCVPNKASDDKCVCCSHVKYASAESSSNVFGSRAFKPATTTGSAVQFGVGSSSTAKPPVFGFGATKPSETATAPAPVATTPSGFQFGAATPAPAAATTVPPVIPPAETATAAPAAVKPIGSLFGNMIKAADSTDPVSAPTASSTPAPSTSLFGNSNINLFGAPKAEPSTAQPSIFGSILNKETSSTTTPAAPVQPSVAPTTSLFGSSTTSTPFGGSSMFAAPKTGMEMPKPSSTLSFGSATSTTSSEAPKTSIFGNLGGNSNAPAPTTTSTMFGPGSSSSSTNLFTTKPADSTTSSIFGKPIQFPGEIGTTTTDGAGPPKRGLFSSDAPKLSFGGDQKVEMPKFGGFGGSTSTNAPTTSGGLFGNSSTVPMFGGSSSNVPAFTSSNSTTAPAFGNSSTVPFGGATSTGFGSFGSMPTQPGMSSSSSTNSLFGQPATDSSNPFGSTNNNGFNFGGASNSTGSSGGSGVFQFGGSAPAAPAPTTAPGGSFQFGANLQPPAPGSMDNAFSYQAPSSSGARKMAMARRRNIRK